MHDHTFGQDAKKPGEVRTLIVVVLTALTMVLEIAAGVVYHSMALLADGLHMASHATALAIATFAYIYARRNARDQRFSFGTGKVNSLAGFAGAILLALFSCIMVWESIDRLLHPISIAFDQALIVAVVGLVVNGLSVFILGHAGLEQAAAAGSPGPSEHDHDHHAHHDHDAHHDHHAHHDHGHAHDHNLRSAYLHVLADTLTSVLAILALLSGKYAGLDWLDPVMGVIGAVLVARWSWGLLKTTSEVLLDRQAPAWMCDVVRAKVAEQGDELADLHCWAVAPGKYALILAIVSERADDLQHYRDVLPGQLPLVHLTIEVWRHDQTVAPQ